MAADEIVYGWHAVRALFARDPVGLAEIWVQARRRDPRAEGLLREAEAAGCAVHRVDRQVLDRMSAGARHQGVAARYRPTAPRAAPDLDDLLAAAGAPALLLVLDGVQDPHNLGACLRSADAAGATGVVVPRDRAAGLSATVRKVACGAAETVPFVEVSNLARALDRIREAGVTVVGAAAEAPGSLYAADLGGPVALVLGGEARGLRRLTRERCDRLVRIPMAGAVASLNVSVAAALCLFEARRQRDQATA